MRLPVRGSPGRENAQTATPARPRRRAAAPPRSPPAASRARARARRRPRREHAAARVGQQQRDHQRVDVDDPGRPQPVPRAPAGPPARGRAAAPSRRAARASSSTRSASSAARRARTSQSPGSPSRAAPSRAAARARRRARRPTPAPTERASQRPDHREREVDEPAVEVRPRAVALDRPDHREPVPGDEGREEAERDHRLARERGPRQARQGATTTAVATAARRCRSRPAARPTTRREQRRDRCQGPPAPSSSRAAQRSSALSISAEANIRAASNPSFTKCLPGDHRRAQGRPADFGPAPGSSGHAQPSSRHQLALLVLVAGLPAGAVRSYAAAAAGKPCWERVIDDWLEDGRSTAVQGGVLPAGAEERAGGPARLLEHHRRDLGRDAAPRSAVTRRRRQRAARAAAGHRSGSDNRARGKPRPTRASPPQSIYRQRDRQPRHDEGGLAADPAARPRGPRHALAPHRRRPRRRQALKAGPSAAVLNSRPS